MKGKFVFLFGNGNVITYPFSTKNPIEETAKNILLLMSLRNDLRNIEGCRDRSRALTKHRKFTLSVLLQNKDVTGDIEGIRYSPKTLTTTVNEIVEKTFNYAMAETLLLGSMELAEMPVVQEAVPVETLQAIEV